MCVNPLKHRKKHQHRDLQCPGCDLKFACFSAMIIHWEASTCLIARHQVNLLLLSVPGNERIVDHGLMQRFLRQKNRSASPSDLDTSTGCYICRYCGSRFLSLAGLDQHVASPVHDPRIFACPSADCDNSFTSLSALAQHVENARCSAILSSRKNVLTRLLEILQNQV